MLVRGDFLHEVPFDPYLPHLFQGEEVLLSARLWTNGYEMFTPNLKICSHDYGRETMPKFWTDENNIVCRNRAEKRARYLLKLDRKTSVLPDFLTESKKFGLGSTRSITAFWKKAGVNLKTKKITTNC